MRRYEKYKASEAKLVDEIPVHWNLKKLSHGFQKIGSGTTPTAGNQDYYLGGEFNWLQTGDLTDTEITSTSKKVTQKALDDFSALKFFSPDSIVIAMYGATIGKTGILKISATTNQACCVLSNPTAFVSKYVQHWFNAKKEMIVSMAYGGGQPNISQETIRSLRIPCPPLEEQTAIANYLDEKTAQIDMLIEKKQKLIELLKEERKAIINEAVSGEGKNWERKKLRFLCRITTGAKNTEDRVEDGAYPFFVRSQTVETINSYSFDGEGILTAGDGVGVAKVFHYINGKFDFHQRVYLFHDFSRDIYVKFLFYYIQQNLIYEVLKYNAKSTVDSLRLAMLKDFEIKFPTSLAEQIKLVEYIEHESIRIDGLIKRVETEVELLTEYKTALISEVVTGKIKVI